MSDLFQEWSRAHTQAENNWQRNFVLPYGSAYTNARASFRKTIDDQEKADKEARERYAALAMFALSLCGGSILTHVFGQACAKTAAGKVALDVICEKEMNRAFKVAAFVESNKTASFALGSVWDGTAGVLSDKLKASLAENGGNFTSLTKFAEEPQSLQNHLEKWVRDAYARVLSAEEDISTNVKDEGQKTAKIRQLMASPFFKAAPAKSPDQSAMEVDIEITLFMKLLLDTDYLAKGYWEEHGGRGGMRKRETSRTAITEDPSSDKYPTWKQTGSMGGVDYQEVIYSQLGDVIKDRIDELNKTKCKDKFFTQVPGRVWGTNREDISRDTLRRANMSLTRLGDANLANIKQSLAA